VNQAALINDRVKSQLDLFQFQQAMSCGSTIPADTSAKTCSGNLRGIYIVNLPSDVAMEGWRCEGDFARAVALFSHDPIYPVIKSMWQNATSGVWAVLVDSGHAQQNSQIALVDSEHDETVISTSALQHFPVPEPLSLISMYPGMSTEIGPIKRRMGYLYPQPDTDQHQAAEHAQAARRVERLTEIQAKLGLSMQMLAEILRISRPQLYKWFDVENSISLQKNSIRRLDEIEQLARKWSAISAAPLKSWVHEQIDGGRSLFDLLKVEPLPIAEVERAFLQIAASIAKVPKSRSARMQAAGFTRRKSHRSLPSDE
jgi:transposase-like protein